MVLYFKIASKQKNNLLVVCLLKSCLNDTSTIKKSCGSLVCFHTTNKPHQSQIGSPEHLKRRVRLFGLHQGSIDSFHTKTTVLNGRTHMGLF